MDITYIQELVEELESEMAKALSVILAKATTDQDEYNYQKGRYHALRRLVDTLKTRHAID